MKLLINVCLKMGGIMVTFAQQLTLLFREKTKGGEEEGRPKHKVAFASF